MDRLPSTSAPQPASQARTKARDPQAWSLASLLHSIRARLISGLIISLPIVITFWIVYWIFMTLERFLLNPLAGLINRIHAWMRNYPALHELDLPDWWYNVGSPVIAIVLVLAVLYMLGLFFRSWVYRTLEWFLLHVPIVATIYRAVRNVVESLGSQLSGGGEFKRVVLVAFPHPGTRSLGLVTNSSARRNHGPYHPDGVRADGLDATGRLHPVRAGRVRHQYRLERQRDAAVDRFRGHHRTAHDPLLRRAISAADGTGRPAGVAVDV